MHNPIHAAFVKPELMTEELMAWPHMLKGSQHTGLTLDTRKEGNLGQRKANASLKNLLWLAFLLEVIG